MPQTISEIWKSSRIILEGKSLEQILKFSGDGLLRDGSTTCSEFRNFLNELPLIKLEEFINECLSISFDGSGFALQDLVNELGKRLGFDVEHGLYRGKKNQIGFDGFWKSCENDIVVEVKTTDTYAINLDVIANYRTNLIEEKRTKNDRSSILLIVGRKDTGGLEAQIRGSKHAWDIRLISIDSLIKIIRLKEELLDNENTFKKICKILRPMEFTRLDYLVDTIFITGKEVQFVESDSITDLEMPPDLSERNTKEKPSPVSFNEECVNIIGKHLNAALVRQKKTLYNDKEKNLGLTCAVSKNHGTEDNPKYWFAFHSHQKESLSRFEDAYVSFGCGNQLTIFIFNYRDFISYLDKMWTTENGSRMYWHVQIKCINRRYFLLRGDKDNIDITNNKIKIDI